MSPDAKQLIRALELEKTETGTKPTVLFRTSALAMQRGFMPICTAWRAVLKMLNTGTAVPEKLCRPALWMRNVRSF
jgi:hypothetical protein